MRHVLVIHGGNPFKNYEDYLAYLKTKELSLGRIRQRDWKRDLPTMLPEDFDVLTPVMPNKEYARYEEWKIWFERILKLLTDDTILIGHSLGGIFLAKYLSENIIPVRIIATFIIAAPYKVSDSQDSGEFQLPDSLEKFQEQGGKIFLYYSEDDSIVPFSNLAKYKIALPNAEEIVFKDRKHFNMREFPEIVDAIKAL